MKAKIERIVDGVEREGRAGSPSTTSSTPDFYSAYVEDVRRARCTRLSGCENIADAADSSGTGYPQLSAEYIVASSPDVIVLADTVCCGQKPSTVAARPGLGSDQRGADGLDRPHRRLDRVALGAAARELLPRAVRRRSRGSQ